MNGPITKTKYAYWVRLELFSQKTAKESFRKTRSPHSDLTKYYYYTCIYSCMCTDVSLPSVLMSGVGIHTYSSPQSLYRRIIVSGVMASPGSCLQPLELFTTSNSVWKFITAVIPNSCFIFMVTCSTCRGQLPSQIRGSTLGITNMNNPFYECKQSLLH